MNLSAKIARDQLKEAQSLLEDFKGFLPQEVIEAQQGMIDNFIDTAIISKNTLEAYRKRDRQGILDGIKLGGANNCIWPVEEVLSKTAAQENSQKFLYETLTGCDRQRSVVLEAYPKLSKRFNVLEDIPDFPKPSIVKRIFIDIFSSREKLPAQELDKILQAQECLTKEDREQMPMETQLAEILEPRHIKTHPTLLQYHGAVPKLIETAVSKNSLERLEALESIGVNFEKEIVLPSVIQAGPNDRKPMMLWLINRKSQFGNAIGHAADLRSVKTIKFLLRNGADPNESAENMIAAIRSQKVETVDLLLAHGADCNLHTDSSSPIGTAIKSFDEEIFSKIWERTTIDTREVLPGQSIFVAIQQAKSTTLENIVRSRLIKHKELVTTPSEQQEIDLF